MLKYEKAICGCYILFIESEAALREGCRAKKKSHSLRGGGLSLTRECGIRMAKAHNDSSERVSG
jgi:hypothetical protein